MVRLEDLQGLLETVCGNVSHIESRGADFPRIVYTEVGCECDEFDNFPAYWRYTVGVDLFSVTEFEPLFKTLMELFTTNNVPFRVEFIEHGTLQNPNAGEKAYEGVTWYRFLCEVGI
jgi:hypothetical protein